MPLGPSGLLIQSPFGFGQDFSTTVGALDAQLNIYSALVDGTGAPIATQPVAADMSISATVTSSNTGVGTITTSPVTIAGAAAFATTQFHAANTGTSTIIASSAGYSSSSVHASVTSLHLSIANGLTIGQFLEDTGSVILSAAAPSGGVTVTLTVNSSLLKLAVNPSDPGSNSITLNIPGGGQSASYWVFGLGSSGSPTYSATAPGYGSGTDTVTLAPSGIAIIGPTTASVSAGPTQLTVLTAQLSTDGQNTPLAQQALAGNTPLTVTLTNTNPSAGTVPASVSIAGGTGSSLVAFTPVGAGMVTKVSVNQPTGFTLPSSNTQLGISVLP